MAKAKKKKLSLKELLEEAIVKEEDRPYEVPENWVWTRLKGIISEIKNGTTIKQNKEKQGVMVTRIESIQKNRIDLNRIGYISDTSKIKETDWYNINDIALSHINSAEHVGKTAIITEELLPLVHGMNLLRLRFNMACDPKYFFYFSQSFEYKNSILERINMAVNQVSINQKQISDIPFPLSPSVEQQRIVEVIESLFKKLDAAKELVENALDSFKNRKAAILHKAFAGELTAKWREENGVSFNEWEEKELDELCTSFQYGTSKKSETSGDVAVLRMGNMQGGEFIWDKLVYTSDEEDIKKYLLKSGDVLFNRTNSPELVGKTSIYRGELPAIFAGYLIRINYKACLIGEYLNYVLNSPKARCYCNEVKSDGVNQSNINAKKLAQFKIPFCSLKEQQEIVRILDNLLGNEQRAKELCDVIEKIDLMKKAILAKAFRGELGTNNPEEESAVELLKEVLKEKL
jgi:type I restriction enzyme S subunit